MLPPEGGFVCLDSKRIAIPQTAPHIPTTSRVDWLVLWRLSPLRPWSKIPLDSSLLPLSPLFAFCPFSRGRNLYLPPFPLISPPLLFSALLSPYPCKQGTGGFSPEKFFDSMWLQAKIDAFLAKYTTQQTDCFGCKQFDDRNILRPIITSDETRTVHDQIRGKFVYKFRGGDALLPLQISYIG